MSRDIEVPISSRTRLAIYLERFMLNHAISTFGLALVVFASGGVTLEVVGTMSYLLVAGVGLFAALAGTQYIARGERQQVTFWERSIFAVLGVTIPALVFILVIAVS